MVPRPVAALTCLFAAVATVSGTILWKIMTGALQQSTLWPAAWLLLSVAATVGLPLMRPWAWRVALIGLVWMVLATLGTAWMFVVSGRPLVGLAATFAAGTLLVVIRYFRRRAIRAWFVGTTPSMRGTEASSTGEPSSS